MDKNTNKVLIRNTKQNLPEKVKCEPVYKFKRDPSLNSRPKKSENPPPSKAFAKMNLDVPIPNTTLHVAKQIQSTKRRIKSIDVDSKHIALQDKITRSLNFPFDKAIYKNLVPLSTIQISEPLSTSRDPLPPKDIEPILGDFVTRKPSVEYTYKVKLPTSSLKTIKEHDPFKIDRILRHW